MKKIWLNNFEYCDIFSKMENFIYSGPAIELDKEEHPQVCTIYADTVQEDLKSLLIISITKEDITMFSVWKSNHTYLTKLNATTAAFKIIFNILNENNDYNLVK